MLTEHDLGHVIDRLLDTTLHMSQVLQELKVTPEELAEWSRRPRVREALDALTALWRLRTDLLAAEGSSDAMLTMIELARCAERHSPELARRAAAAILKHSTVAQAFQPVPTSPTPSSPTPPPRGERGQGGGPADHSTHTPRPETPSSPAPLPSRKGLGEGSDDRTSPTTSTSDPSSPTPPPTPSGTGFQPVPTDPTSPTSPPPTPPSPAPLPSRKGPAEGSSDHTSPTTSTSDPSSPPPSSSAACGASNPASSVAPLSSTLPPTQRPPDSHPASANTRPNPAAISPFPTIPRPPPCIPATNAHHKHMHSQCRRYPAPLAFLAPLTGLALAFGGLAPSTAVAAPSFTLLGLPEGSGGGGAFGLSADGRAAAGWTASAGYRGFLWTAGGGRNDFGFTVPTQATRALGISGDGLVVVGGGPASAGDSAFRWSQTGGYQMLGTLPGYDTSMAQDANHDGSIVVGTVENPGGTQAFRWTEAGGMQGLGGGTRTRAISGDGNVIVGDTEFSPRAFTWTQANGFQFLPTLDGAGGSYAFATNFTGNVVVGLSGAVLRGTIWNNGTPIELLPSIPNTVLTPSGVSDDGSVVVGNLTGSGAGLNQTAVWTASTGVMRLSDYFLAHGVPLSANINLGECTAVSADGQVFAGYTEGGLYGLQGWVATVPAPCPADLDNDGSFPNGPSRDHAVTIDDLLYFLTGFEAGSTLIDLDNGSNTGTPDNAVTIDDLLFFLTHFEAGC